MTDIICPYCSSDRCKKEYDLTWPLEGFSNYSVARCMSCDTGFVLPLPTPQELDDLYNGLEYHSEIRTTVNASSSDEEIARIIEENGRILRKYKPHVPPSGHVLDVGAGWGTLLKYFANYGYQTTGLELSTQTAEFARNKLGLEIYNIPVERIDELPDQTYDLVTMRHVMEHFYEPTAVLAKLRQTMSVGSKLIIEVPDYGSFDRKSYAESWPAFAPYHLWYFSRASLQRLLEDAGFEVLLFHTFMSERVLAGASPFHRIARKMMIRLGGKHLFTGRSIGLIAQKRN